MSRQKLKFPVKLITKFSDGFVEVRYLERSEAVERFRFYVMCDLEGMLTSLVSMSIVAGTHLRYYYETNHHQKHVNSYNHDCTTTTIH